MLRVARKFANNTSSSLVRDFVFLVRLEKRVFDVGPMGSKEIGRENFQSTAPKRAWFCGSFFFPFLGGSFEHAKPVSRRAFLFSSSSSREG